MIRPGLTNTDKQDFILTAPIMNVSNVLLFEVSAEVCRKVGGIHTVIRSKAAYIKKYMGNDYFMIGQYDPSVRYDEVFCPAGTDEIRNDDVVRAINHLRGLGMPVYSGFWNIEGRPQVILIDSNAIPANIEEIKLQYAARNQLPVFSDLRLFDEMFSFGYYLELFFKTLCDKKDFKHGKKVIAHFHEYMTTVSLPGIRRLSVSTVFTTHSTVAGRFMASMARDLYKSTVLLDGAGPSKEMPLQYHVLATIERIAARECDVFTTVSDLTARECARLLGREPDVTPNGVNVGAIRAEAQLTASDCKRQIREVVDRHLRADGLMGAEQVYYFFSSGRYEFVNKGYDVIIPALAELNRWLRKSKPKVAVVMFFITDHPTPPKPGWDYAVKHWKNRIASLWAKPSPDIFMHEVPNYLRGCQLIVDLLSHGLSNKKSDPVKVLFHPQFLNRNSPSLKMDYLSFVKGCDLGLFPSYYDPWGYTPVECLASGVPAVTTNVTGVGNFISKQIPFPEDSGLFVVDRLRKNRPVEHDLFNVMKKIITNRGNYSEKLDRHASAFDWNNMISCYFDAYRKAIGDYVVV